MLQCKKKKIDEETEESCESCQPSNSFKEQLNFREIFLTGDVKDSLVERAIIPIINFNRFDDALDDKFKDYERQPIKLFIHTSGGEIDACMALISTIKASKTPIHTIAMGKAYSAGFLILIAGHERYIQEYGSVMVHPGSGGYIGSFPSILKHADEIHKLQERVNEYVVENTFIEKDELDEMCEHEYNWYMYADEALCRGVVDGIIVNGGVVTLEDYIAAQEEIAKKEEKKAAKKAKKKEKK